MTKAPCAICGKLVALNGLDRHIDRHKRVPHREGLVYKPSKTPRFAGRVSR